MFRSSTILRELVESLAKVIFLLKHSVKLRRCIMCGDVASCHRMACVARTPFHAGGTGRQQCRCIVPKAVYTVKKVLVRMGEFVARNV